MSLLDRLVVVTAKIVSRVSIALGLGAGETWPGEIALTLRPSIARPLCASFADGFIIVAGTNGKTTTTGMIRTLLESAGHRVVHNETGANLLNGIVSSIIRRTDWMGRTVADVGVFEVDENSLPIVLSHVRPTHLVLLNLFRDQLDRYGEVDVIIEKWQRALRSLPKTTHVILNSDDPGIAGLGVSVGPRAIYFGLTETNTFLKAADHATDSVYCPACGHKLTYKGMYYSHIGHWFCPSCKNTRPAPSVHSWESPLPGLYNRSNTQAAVAVALSFGMKKTEIKKSLSTFTPAFGRQESLVYRGTTVKIFLSKNPAGFNASIRTVLELGATDIVLLLNDRIPDGRDVSWIWDIDVEMIPKTVRLSVGGDRAYDMALRVKYADLHPVVETDLQTLFSHMNKRKTVYVLATYSAMLEARKILKGRKIL